MINGDLISKDKFGHYVRWGLVLLDGLVYFGMVMLEKPIPENFWWLTVGILGVALGKQFTKEMKAIGFKADAAKLTQLAEVLTNGKATENAPSGAKPAEVVSTPTPEKTEAKIGTPKFAEEHVPLTLPVPSHDKAGDISVIPPQLLPVVEEWYAAVDSKPPVMPTVTLAGVESFTPDQLREARMAKAYEAFREQLNVAISDNADSELSQKALPIVGCKALAGVSAAITALHNKAQSNWLTYAVDLWNYQEGPHTGSLPGASPTSGNY